MSTFLTSTSTLIVPLADRQNALLVLCAGQAISAIGATMWSVHQISLHQTITPVNLFARATAARRFLIFGMSTGGAALGGWLGGSLGLRATLLIGAVVFSLGFVIVLLSPVRTMGMGEAADE